MTKCEEDRSRTINEGIKASEIYIRSVGFDLIFYLFQLLLIKQDCMDMFIMMVESEHKRRGDK